MVTLASCLYWLSLAVNSRCRMDSFTLDPWTYKAAEFFPATTRHLSGESIFHCWQSGTPCDWSNLIGRSYLLPATPTNTSSAKDKMASLLGKGGRGTGTGDESLQFVERAGSATGGMLAPNST